MFYLHRLHFYAIFLNQGWVLKTLIQERWSENPELQPGFEPRNAWIKSRDASQYATLELKKIQGLTFGDTSM